MMQSELPSAYHKVEYLESSGTQRISTHIAFARPAIASVELVGYVKSGSGSVMYGFGPTLASWIGFAKGEDQFRCGDASTAIFPKNIITAGQRGKFITEWPLTGGTTCTCNGFTAYELAGTDNKQSFELFAAYNGYGALMRLYGVRLTMPNGSYNFIPCVRKSDSKPGMYDTLTKTFYTNTGTGEFIVPN